MPREFGKYEALYLSDPKVCGDPFPEFVAFADRCNGRGRSVLDLGCGQGRDAFVFARKGFRVVGVDLSPSGVSQMTRRAEEEGLEIVGVVEDVRNYRPSDTFNIIILDRTLHMLPDESDHIAVLDYCASSLKPGGHMLIADERSNMPGIIAFFEREDRRWTFQEGLKPSFLFASLTNAGKEQSV